MRWKERTKVTKEEWCQGIRGMNDKFFDISIKTDNRFLGSLLRGTEGKTAVA